MNMQKELSFRTQLSSIFPIKTENIGAQMSYMVDHLTPANILMIVAPEPRADFENPGHAFLIQMAFSHGNSIAKVIDFGFRNGRMERVEIDGSYHEANSRIPFPIFGVIENHINGINQLRSADGIKPLSLFMLIKIIDTRLPAVVKRFFQSCLP